MSTAAERQDANVSPPTASATPGVGVTCVQVPSASTLVLDLDAYPGFFDRYLDFAADGGKVYVTFDDTSTGNIDTAAYGATLVAGTQKTHPWPIQDGEVRAYRLDKGAHRYLKARASTGTPLLRITPSSQTGRMGE